MKNVVRFFLLVLFATSVLAANAQQYNASHHRKDYMKIDTTAIMADDPAGAYIYVSFEKTTRNATLWLAKVPSGKFDTAISFWLDSLCTQPLNLFDSEELYGEAQANDKEAKVSSREQTFEKNYIKQPLSGPHNYRFFISQEIIERWRARYVSPGKKFKFYFKYHASGEGMKYNIVDIFPIENVRNGKEKPGWMTYDYSADAYTGGYDYGFWATFMPEELSMDIDMEFDNGAKEKFYGFEVNFCANQEISYLCNQARTDDNPTPFKYRISFWKDSLCTDSLFVDAYEFLLPDETGYLEPNLTTNDRAAKSAGLNGDRCNYVEGTLISPDLFQFYIGDVAISGMFDQAVGRWDKDTTCRFYYTMEADIATPTKIIRHFKAVKPGWIKYTYTAGHSVERVYTRLDEFESSEGEEKSVPVIPQKPSESENKTKESGGGNQESGECTCPSGSKCICGDTCKCKKPPIPPRRPKCKCQSGDRCICGNNCQCADPEILPPSPNPPTTCDHEWVSKVDVFRFPTPVYITVGSQVKIPMRLVKDETNDSIFFYIMEQPVWQSLYEYEMDENPSAQVSETNPVTNVGISDAKFFRDRFAVDIVPNTGLKFRLPTKEEWLLAARALPELKLGEQVDEVLSDGIIMSKGTNDEPPRPIAYYFGSRNVTGQPELKKNTNISSDRTGFRLVADRTVESAALDVDFNNQTALPSGQTVTTQPVTHTYKKYRRVLRFYHYNQCRKCGAVKSINK